ncbi:universal stress protein [Oceanimonas marisflavi]|uniref:universal stress protein n=1 Tax=Oceanimonas marisflavi TaxID=2059724 RepID=UPI000D31FC0D|nr:universal stress protein [Oceanimonas marisflavi]
MFRHCIAGIDFSAGWDQSRAQLTRMVPLLGIQQLTLLHADEPHHRSHKEASANRRTHLEQLATDMAASLTIPTEPVFVSGFATSSLLEIASRREAGLLLIANNSHSRGQDFILTPSPT